jgi:hypothetical protein
MVDAKEARRLQEKMNPHPIGPLASSSSPLDPTSPATVIVSLLRVFIDGRPIMNLFLPPDALGDLEHISLRVHQPPGVYAAFLRTMCGVLSRDCCFVLLTYFLCLHIMLA